MSEVSVVDCRSDLFPMYNKRGFVEVKRYPVEKYVNPKGLTRKGLSMVMMRKKRQ
jgi:hypothetical protein